MSKIAAVIQKPEETPTDFYERLSEAFWVYTPFDPEVPENQQMVIAAFVANVTFAGNFRNLKVLLA
jgi:hypothetical protein